MKKTLALLSLLAIIAPLSLTSCFTPTGGTPTASVGAQAGTITAGAAGSATFTVTTANVAAGTAGTVTWYTSSAGSTAGSAPTGITATASAVSGNAATVTVTVTAAAAAGTYYFTVTYGSAVSSVATLTVGAAATLMWDSGQWDNANWG